MAKLSDILGGEGQLNPKIYSRMIHGFTKLRSTVWADEPGPVPRPQKNSGKSHHCVSAIFIVILGVFLHTLTFCAKFAHTVLNAKSMHADCRVCTTEQI